MNYTLDDCKFCGAHMMLSDASDPGPVLMEFGVVPDPHVRCKNCGSQTDEFETRAEAIEAWNRRAPRGMINRKMDCPDCGPKFKLRSALFAKEIAIERKREKLLRKIVRKQKNARRK